MSTIGIWRGSRFYCACGTTVEPGESHSREECTRLMRWGWRPVRPVAVEQEFWDRARDYVASPPTAIDGLLPAPSPPLPEVGSRWLSMWDGAIRTVTAIDPDRMHSIATDDRLWTPEGFHAAFKPIPPAPAAEPDELCEHGHDMPERCRQCHAAKRIAAALAEKYAEPLDLSPLDGEATYHEAWCAACQRIWDGDKPTPACDCGGKAAPPTACLCADDGPGHWDARCPLFEASGACVCGEPGRAGSVHRKDGPCYQRACVCLSRDCGECGPKLEREAAMGSGPPWGKLFAEAWRKYRERQR